MAQDMERAWEQADTERRRQKGAPEEAWLRRSPITPEERAPSPRRSFTTCAALLAAQAVGSGVAWGQGMPATDDVFTLSIEGPSQLSGPANEAKSGTYYARLKQEAGPDSKTGPAVQGWSYGVAVAGGLISNLTTAGTASDFLPPAGAGRRDMENSFNQTVLIDPAENGGVNGFVSAIVLTTAGLPEAVLDPGSDVRILQFQLHVTIPTGTGTATMQYQEDLVGTGQPVALVASQEGTTANLVTVPLTVDLVEVRSCCDAETNVGFAETSIRGQPPFTGIIGKGDLCRGDEGEVIQFSTAGATPTPKRIYPTIVSDLPSSANVQGWSFGVLLQGTGAIIGFDVTGTATALLTATPPGYRDPESAFHKSEVLNPAKNNGKKGLVHAVALTQAGNPLSVLPSVGTESVLGIDVAAGEPQGDADQVNTLSYELSLVGSGTGVALVVTVNGATGLTCGSANAPWHARVDVIFRKAEIATFIRGNANNDNKVDIADGIWIINELVRSGPPALCQDAADANDDGNVDVSDAVYLIFYQFQPSDVPNPDPPPPDPFLPDDCGPDPTDDAVGCGQSQIDICGGADSPA